MFSDFRMARVGDPEGGGDTMLTDIVSFPNECVGGEYTRGEEGELVMRWARMEVDAYTVAWAWLEKWVFCKEHRLA